MADYMNQRLSGRVTFDYSNNNGKYIIGNNELLFETAWSKASDDSIYILNDPASIKGVALALGKHRITDINDASSYDMTSRTRTPQEGEIVILKNRFGNYAALKIIDIKDRTRSDDRDELTFEYVINPNEYIDFSQTELKKAEAKQNTPPAIRQRIWIGLKAFIKEAYRLAMRSFFDSTMNK